MSFVGGKLSLKGGAALPGVDKKKKKKKNKKDKEKTEEDAQDAQRALVVVEEGGGGDGGQAEEGTSVQPPPPADTRTEAQRRHDAAMAAREAARIKALAAKSHRERVDEFNAHLASLSEHHDIPKVGPG
jgi:protein FAM32A